MILTHGLSSIARTPPIPSEVVIGEHTYPVVKIGNRLWTAKGLYEKQSESAGAIPIERGSSTKLDIETYGLIYYGWNMFSILSDIIPDGWRFPKYADLVDLMSTFPNYTAPNKGVDGRSVCTTSYWNTPGTNETGLGMIPIHSYGHLNDWYGYIAANEFGPDGYNYEMTFSNSTIAVISTIYMPGRYFGARLCRDI